MNPSSPPRPIRLAFAVLFWRLFLGFTFLFALIVGLSVVNRVPPQHVLFAFFFRMIPCVAVSFSFSSFLTLIVSLTVGLIVRPRMLGWLAPRSEEGHAAFHLEPREHEVSSSPARLAQGRSWAPGRLVLTDRRLLFLPNAWDVEPWTLRFDRLLDATPTPAPRAFWGLVENIPPRLRVAETSQPPHEFAMLDAPAWASLLAMLSHVSPAERSEYLRR
jgi:hypothetical protein